MWKFIASDKCFVVCFVNTLAKYLQNVNYDECIANLKGISKISSPVVRNNGEVMKLSEIVGKCNIWVAGCTVKISWPTAHCEPNLCASEDGTTIKRVF